MNTSSHQAVSHAPSAQVLQQMREEYTFQISVDNDNLPQALIVADAALASGVTIVEMGTPLLKFEGVKNVVPAFRKSYPHALLLADMKTMDGGGSEAEAVFANGGNIIDFMVLSGVDTAKAICKVRDAYRESDLELPRLVFADILLPHLGANAADAACEMLDAGVDGIGIHLQLDARRANPDLFHSDYLFDAACALREKVGDRAPLQVVGGLSVAQACALAHAGIRALVISGNLGIADGSFRLGLPYNEMQRHISLFMQQVREAGAPSEISKGI